MALNNREIECAERLVRFLEERKMPSSYRNGDDPPDFVFNVNNEVWAVEHTRLEQRIQGDSKPVSKQQSVTEDFKCRRRIATRLGNSLRGIWYLHCEGPFNRTQYKVIEDAVCTAISSDDPSLLLPELQKLARIPAGKTSFFEDSITLSKSSNIGSGLVCGSSLRPSAQVPNSHAMAADILATNIDAVEHMIQKKRCILNRLKNTCEYDSITLLLDSQLAFGDPDRIIPLLIERIKQLSAVDRFYIIYMEEMAEIEK